MSRLARLIAIVVALLSCAELCAAEEPAFSVAAVLIDKTASFQLAREHAAAAVAHLHVDGGESYPFDRPRR